MYSIISKYYDDLVNLKNINLQVQVILKTIYEFSNNNNISIHDASCGTGIALSYLNKIGFNNISGSDICTEMLDIAKKKLIDIELIKSSFYDLNKNEKKYDIIYSMGNSFSHFNGLEELEYSLASLKKSLSDHSVLIIDFNLWNYPFENIVTNDKYELFNKKKVIINNIEYKIYKKIRDNNFKQYVDFKIINLKTKKEKFTTLTYLKYSINQFINLSKKIGFSTINVHYNFIENYPYIVAILTL